MEINEITKLIINCAIEIHTELGPGLLELVYETILHKMLIERGLNVERQKSVSFAFKGFHFDDGFRIDLLVNDIIMIELKSVEKLLPYHHKQLLTYLRLMNRPVGLLINFGTPTLKEGLKRIVNKYEDNG